LKWSELEKLFRCDKDERVLDKIVKQAMQYELAIAESQERVGRLHQNPNSPRARAHKAMRVQIEEPKGFTPTKMLNSGSGEGMTSLKTSPGSQTQRTAAHNMGKSLPMPAGTSTLAGSLSFMGKTSLFSRVALSPGAAVEKKGMTKNGPDSDRDTNLGTTQAGTTMGKTLRSSTTTTNFKEAIQKGVLSGAGILKPK